ncbi:hypothetical protein KQI88_15395 [Alkaliphilus sp. MSJ-5]|uniref:Uncharacterized protein n=1 Tax=Alkaliphilus flagellatus TaxID=2841507 RepID=A0ABS6G5P1_9FIRM|nr:hypothetical protein [Alkaliphilus flagellatus]MBU5677802.1 hypothetical protein [Alkaliphilus flagellatus]
MKQDILLAIIPVLGYIYYVCRSYAQFKKKEYNPERIILGDSLIGLSPAISLYIINSAFIKNMMLLMLFILMMFITFMNFRFYKYSGKIKFFFLSSTILASITMLLFNGF